MLGSPVQSGFSSKFGKTETETGPLSLEMLKNPDWTFRDQSTAVFCGFLWLKDRSVTGLEGGHRLNNHSSIKFPLHRISYM